VKQKIRVWDLPIRLFHWALALCVILGIIFVKIGGNAMQWHAYCGYIALALVLFRIIWGFLGSWHSRFANFIPTPKRLIVHRFNQYIIMALVALHIGAILFYQFYKKESLVAPMITGDKNGEEAFGGTAPPEPIDTGKQRLVALTIFIVVGLGLYYLIN